MNSTETEQKDSITNTVLPSSEKKCCGIYGLQNKLNGKWYIGQSWDIPTRWAKGYKYINCKCQPKLYNALKKYGYDGFNKVILEECNQTVSQEILDQKETGWIKSYNSVDNGYNISYGGTASMKGRKHSDVSKQKMKLAKVGKALTEPHKARIKASMVGKIPTKLFVTGRTTTETHRKNLSMSLQGRSVSDETKRKIGLANKGKKYGSPSTETRNKIKNSLLGHSVSVETRQKMSVAAKLRHEKRKRIFNNTESYLTQDQPFNPSKRPEKEIHDGPKGTVMNGVANHGRSD